MEVELLHFEVSKQVDTSETERKLRAYARFTFNYKEHKEAIAQMDIILIPNRVEFEFFGDDAWDYSILTEEDLATIQDEIIDSFVTEEPFLRIYQVLSDMYEVYYNIPHITHPKNNEETE